MTITRRKVTVSGGFHNVPEMAIYAKGSRDDLTLSPYQVKKIKDHVCGVEGCRCGSATITDNDGRFYQFDSFAGVLYKIPNKYEQYNEVDHHM